MPTLDELIGEVDAENAAGSGGIDIDSLISEVEAEDSNQQPIMTSGRVGSADIDLNIIEEQHPSMSNVDRLAAKNINGGSAEAGVFASRVPKGANIVLADDGRIVAEDVAGSKRYFPIDPNLSPSSASKREQLDALSSDPETAANQVFSDNPLATIVNRIKEGFKEPALDSPVETAAAVGSTGVGLYTGGLGAPAATTAISTAAGDFLTNQILRDRYGDFVEQRSVGEDAANALTKGGFAGATEYGGGKALGYLAKGGLAGTTARKGKELIDDAPNAFKTQYEKTGMGEIIKKPIKSAQGYLASFTTPEGQAVRFLKSNELVGKEAISPIKNRSLNKFGKVSGTDGIVDNIVNLYKFVIDDTGNIVKNAKPTTKGSFGNLITSGNTEQAYELVSQAANKSIEEMASYADDLKKIDVPLSDIVNTKTFKDFAGRFGVKDLTSAFKRGAYNKNLMTIVDDLEQVPQIRDGIASELERITKLDGKGLPVDVTDADRFQAFMNFAKSPVGKKTRLTAADLLELKRATQGKVIDYSDSASNFSQEGIRGLANVYREGYRDSLNRMVGGDRLKDLEELSHNLIQLRTTLGLGVGDDIISKNQLTANIPSPINSLVRAGARSVDKAIQSEWGRQLGMSVANRTSAIKDSLTGQLSQASSGLGKVWNALPSASTMQTVGRTTGLATAPFLSSEISSEPRKPMPIANSVDAFAGDPLAMRDLIELTGDSTIELQMADNAGDRESMHRILLNYKDLHPEAFAGGFGIDGVLAPSEIPQYDNFVKKEHSKGTLNSYELLEEKKAMQSAAEGNLVPQPFLIRRPVDPAPTRLQVSASEPTPDFNSVASRVSKNPLPSQTITEASKSRREDSY